MVQLFQLKSNKISLEYKKARKHKYAQLEKNGQLNLFENVEPNIFHLPVQNTPFEKALWLDEHDSEDAQEAYMKAILSGDHPADACCNLGLLEWKSGNLIKAFDYFSKSLKYDERHFEAHYNLANLYFENKDYRLAKLHYEIAAEIHPDYPKIYFNLGIVYALLDFYEEACLALQHYKSLIPKKAGKKADNLLKGLLNSLSKN
jgi:tetratricopeptide (TPR) repeat protein